MNVSIDATVSKGWRKTSALLWSQHLEREVLPMTSAEAWAMTLAADRIWPETVGETISHSAGSSSNADAVVIRPSSCITGAAAKRPAIPFGKIDRAARGIWPSAKTSKTANLRMMAMMVVLDARHGVPMVLDMARGSHVSG